MDGTHEIERPLGEPLRLSGKRFLDLLMAIAASPAVVPVILLLWIVVKLDGGPGFFGQPRIGRGGRVFTCWKLRTMVQNADEVLRAVCGSDDAIAREWRETQKIRNDPRITRIGRFLRKTSLDELPQFWNVLRGEMSFVGPRPVVPGEIARYGDKAADYLSVTPGITGLWQVSGRNRLTYAQRVRLDAFYARRRTLTLDLLIVARTVPELLWRRSGV